VNYCDHSRGNSECARGRADRRRGVCSAGARDPGPGEKDQPTRGDGDELRSNSAHESMVPRAAKGVSIFAGALWCDPALRGEAAFGATASSLRRLRILHVVALQCPRGGGSQLVPPGWSP
jgi:hypothetical protein